MFIYQKIYSSSFLKCDIQISFIQLKSHC